MKKRTKAKKPAKKREKPINEITGTVVVYNQDRPGHWQGLWNGEAYWVMGRPRDHATIRWPDGSISENVPMPIFAQPPYDITFTLRPA